MVGFEGGWVGWWIGRCLAGWVVGSLFFICLFVLLLYVPSQQLWSLQDGQFT